MTAALLTAAGIAVAVPLGLLLWLNRTLVAVDVVGQSMEPAFHHGDRVLVRRVPARRLRVGDVAVLGRPDTEDLQDLALLVGSLPPWVVKRVAALPGDPVPGSVPAEGGTVPPGRLVVLGDNTGNSTDSRVWGPVPDDRVLGVVLRRMASRPARSSGSGPGSRAARQRGAAGPGPAA
ncbi:hypothetical protein SUDANB121_03188 [Nocardiopsis dassonvillei]|uniref:S26 family signal peptidase n=1 Tax=Nocardiopsis dassonvillei TaxID=2014 RepID=UPI003F5437A1